MDLLNRAHVVFLDDNDHEVQIDCVAIQWDEG